MINRSRMLGLVALALTGSLAPIGFANRGVDVIADEYEQTLIVGGDVVFLATSDNKLIALTDMELLDNADMLEWVDRSPSTRYLHDKLMEMSRFERTHIRNEHKKKPRPDRNARLIVNAKPPVQHAQTREKARRLRQMARLEAKKGPQEGA